MTQDTVVVTQSAREAAADHLETENPDASWYNEGRDIRILCERIRLGYEDNHSTVQAIAAAEQRGFKLCQDAAVKVAEQRISSFGDNDHEQTLCHKHGGEIADAIRTLSIKETGNAG